MTLKRVALFLSFVLVILGTAYAVDYDKQYSKTYGTGIIIASDKGLPLRDKFVKSQIDFKNGISYVKGGPDATFSFRAFLKDGKDYNYYMNLKKKGYDASKIVEGSERIVVTFWASHSFRGDKQMDAWPKKLEDGEHLSNTAELGSISFGMSEVMDYKDSGADWENITTNFDGAFKNWIANAKPGYKLYMSLNISFVINTEWDPIAQKWNTMLCQSQPLAAGTAEFK